MLTFAHILFVLIAVVVWCLFVVFRPYGKCWRCHGMRVLRKKAQPGKRAPKPRRCWACHGRGHCPTPGARLVHGLLHELAGEKIRQRRRDAAEAWLENRENEL